MEGLSNQISDSSRAAGGKSKSEPVSIDTVALEIDDIVAVSRVAEDAVDIETTLIEVYSTLHSVRASLADISPSRGTTEESSCGSYLIASTRVGEAWVGSLEGIALYHWVSLVVVEWTTSDHRVIQPGIGVESCSL